MLCTCRVTDSLYPIIPADTDLDPNSPPKRLQEALSSKRAFQSLYLVGSGFFVYETYRRVNYAVGSVITAGFQLNNMKGSAICVYMV